nr:hypothetical protein [Nocardia amamiensis]
MGAVDDRRPVLVVPQRVRVGVAGMPLVDDQGRGSGAERADLIVQRHELVRNRHAGVVLPVAAEPVGGALYAIAFAARPVDGSVGKPVRIAGQRHLRIAEERRQRCQGTIEAVGAAPGKSGSAVVDQPPVRVGTWVGADCEAIALTQRILDHRLVDRVFQVGELIVVDDASVGQTGEPGGGVCGGDVVADLPQVFRTDGRILAICWQAQMLAHAVGERFGAVLWVPGSRVARAAVDVDGQVCGGWVVGEDDVDHQPVTVEQSAAVVEGAVCCQVRVFDQIPHLLRGDVRAGFEVDPHADYGDMLGSFGIPAHLVGGDAGCPVRPHRDDSIVFGCSASVVLSCVACLECPLCFRVYRTALIG